MTELTFTVEPGGALHGRLRVPGDKSISHRAIMLGALAKGTTTISGFLEGEDCLATLRAFRAMGVRIEGPERGQVTVYGVGLNGLRPPAEALDMGNSGTSMRLMAGILAGQPFDSTLIGDASLMRRPMGRVTVPLAQMGARIDSAAQGTAPLRIHGGGELTGIDYPLPVASAQVKSCLLLAGLYARGVTRITEPAPTRDHTERMLEAFGYPLQRENDRTVALVGGGQLLGAEIDVPADLSSAAFFLVGASIAPGSDLVLEHVGLNQTRSGVIDILRLMGADIEVLEPRLAGTEPVVDLRVRYAPLRGLRIPDALVPLAIDELPALFVAAACAEGETVFAGAEELRVKESDRIQAMADGLAALGIAAKPLPDGIIIQGGSSSGGLIDSHGDHRIAMSFSIAALRAHGPIRVRDCANVNTSFPDFASLSRHVGLAITELES